MSTTDTAPAPAGVDEQPAAPAPVEYPHEVTATVTAPGTLEVDGQTFIELDDDLVELVEKPAKVFPAVGDVVVFEIADASPSSGRARGRGVVQSVPETGDLTVVPLAAYSVQVDHQHVEPAA